MKVCKFCHAEPVMVKGSPHDACIADLPGVRFACCGHGVLRGLNHCYVVFDDGAGEELVLYGRAARAAMEMFDRDLPPVPGARLPYPFLRWITRLPDGDHAELRVVRCADGTYERVASDDDCG